MRYIVTYLGVAIGLDQTAIYGSYKDALGYKKECYNTVSRNPIKLPQSYIGQYIYLLIKMLTWQIYLFLVTKLQHFFLTPLSAPMFFLKISFVLNKPSFYHQISYLIFILFSILTQVYHRNIKAPQNISLLVKLQSHKLIYNWVSFYS